MRSLLDVNVLIALLDPDHIHHAAARTWLRTNGAGGWASCPITQNGCVRIMSLPNYPNNQPVSAIPIRINVLEQPVTHLVQDRSQGRPVLRAYPKRLLAAEHVLVVSVMMSFNTTDVMIVVVVAQDFGAIEHADLVGVQDSLQAILSALRRKAVSDDGLCWRGRVSPKEVQLLRVGEPSANVLGDRLFPRMYSRPHSSRGYPVGRLPAREGGA